LLQKLIASQKNQHIASDPDIPDLTIVRPNGVSKNRPQVHTPSLWYILADIRPHWTSRRQLTTILDKPAFSRIYAPQTKILEGRTNISERVFEALFNVL
jgi:hypothetical protein